MTAFWKNAFASVGVGAILLFIGGAATFTFDVVGRLAAIEATQKLILEILLKK